MRRIFIPILLLIFAKINLFRVNAYDTDPDTFSAEEFFESMLEPPMPCIKPFDDCTYNLKEENKTQVVCGYDKSIGLRHFVDVCLIHLVNCLSRPNRDHVYGVSYVDDPVYFNGQNHSCAYYFKQTMDVEELVSLYYADETEQIDNTID